MVVCPELFHSFHLSHYRFILSQAIKRSKKLYEVGVSLPTSVGICTKNVTGYWRVALWLWKGLQSWTFLFVINIVFLYSKISYNFAKTFLYAILINMSWHEADHHGYTRRNIFDRARELILAQCIGKLPCRSTDCLSVLQNQPENGQWSLFNWNQWYFNPVTTAEAFTQITGSRYA
jgi:hypothetical protein